MIKQNYKQNRASATRHMRNEEFLGAKAVLAFANVSEGSCAMAGPDGQFLG